MEEILGKDTPELDPCGDVEETNTNLYFPMADSASPMASMQQSRHDLGPLGTYFGHPMQADLNNEAVMML